MVGSSYPLDDVLLGVAEHTAFKYPPFFFQREGKKSQASSDHVPFPKTTPLLPPPVLQTPPLLPACFPWPQTKCFMWLDLRQVGGRPPPCPQKTLVFQWEQGVLVLAGWSRGLKGFSRGRPPPREQEIKEKEHFHTASVLEGLYAPVEPRSCFKPFFYDKSSFLHEKNF